MTKGLILGKFAPFHIGHQFIIETAAREVDEVNIIVYDCPDLTNIPLNQRANWIRKLYPRVNVIEGWDAPNEHEDTSEVKRKQERYAEKALQGKQITHFISSEYYGEHMSKFLNAVNRIVDMNRKKHPISATMIRKNAFDYRHYMPMMVYKDILIKIAIIGIPSKEQNELVKTLGEYYDTYYLQDNLQLSQNNINFYKIAQGKNKSRSDASKIYSGREYLFYNSSPLIDHCLSVLSNREFNENLYNLAINDLCLYDLILINDTKDSGYYNIDSMFFKNQVIGNLNFVKAQYELLTGTLDKKFTTAKRIISKIKPRFIK